MPGDYHADELLAKNAQCVDKAYLEGVWRYVTSLGKRFEGAFGTDFDAQSVLFQLPPTAGASSTASGSGAVAAPSSSSGAAASSCGPAEVVSCKAVEDVGCKAASA